MSMKREIRIGTRDSKLAVWQARHTATRLEELGVRTELVYIKSRGDVDLTTPLIEMGGKGVFTKALDEALLDQRIDLAVHSFKDLPTENPLPLRVAAVLEREDPRDCLVVPEGGTTEEFDSTKKVIATSSHRRRAQWLHRYPHHDMTHIRGNIQTRIRKVDESGWGGAIFAVAGLKRMELDDRISEYLDWMIPAPAQGAVAVMTREDDEELIDQVSQLEHRETAICTGIERELLNRMEAGCSAPVGAYAWIDAEETLTLQAIALTLDGSLQYDVELSAPVAESEGLGIQAADALLEQGAAEIIENLDKTTRSE